MLVEGGWRLGNQLQNHAIAHSVRDPLPFVEAGGVYLSGARLTQPWRWNPQMLLPLRQDQTKGLLAWEQSIICLIRTAQSHQAPAISFLAFPQIHSITVVLSSALGRHSLEPIMCLIPRAGDSHGQRH